MCLNSMSLPSIVVGSPRAARSSRRSCAERGRDGPPSGRGNRKSSGPGRRPTSAGQPRSSHSATPPTPATCRGILRLLPLVFGSFGLAKPPLPLAPMIATASRTSKMGGLVPRVTDLMRTPATSPSRSPPVNATLYRARRSSGTTSRPSASLPSMSICAHSTGSAIASSSSASGISARTPGLRRMFAEVLVHSSTESTRTQASAMAASKKTVKVDTMCWTVRAPVLSRMSRSHWRREGTSIAASGVFPKVGRIQFFMWLRNCPNVAGATFGFSHTARATCRRTHRAARLPPCAS